MLISAILLAASTAGDPNSVLIDKVVGIVDSTVYFRSDLIAEAHRAAKVEGIPNPDTEEHYAKVLDQFVMTAVVLVDAKRSKIDAASYEIDQAAENMARDRKTTVDKLYAEQEAAGVSKALLRESIRREIVVQRWINQKVMPRMPRGLSYEKDKAGFEKAYRDEIAKVVAELRKTVFVEIRL